jgi:glycosyltransferase involved in cell wall biosynthesis
MRAAVVSIIDNSLKDFTGHHFEYIRSIASELQTRNISTLVVAHCKALRAFDDFFPVERAFHRSHYEWPCRIRKIGFFVNLWILNRSFYADLNRTLRHKVTKDWLLFAPNVNHLELFAWAIWLRRIPAKDRPQVRLFMRWSYYQNEDPRVGERFTFVARLAFRALQKLSVVRLVTDSERLADEYSRLSRLPVQVLPVPHTELPVSASLPSAVPVVVFLGGARSEKGFAVLVEAARLMRNDPVRLIVQCHRDDPDDTAAAAAHLELEKMEDARIRLIREPLDSTAYYQLLESADVVVIPYRSKSYRARTSGILVEALAAGKPVVVTSGTWMADQVAPAKVGVMFEDGDARDLRRAILQLTTTLNEYRERAIHHRSQWLSFHNPSTLVEMLLA